MNSAGKQLPRNAVPDGQRLPEPLLVRGDGPAEDAGPVRVALEGDHLVPHDLRRIFHWQVDERLAVLDLEDALVEDEGRRVVAREVLRDALEPPAAVEAHD